MDELRINFGATHRPDDVVLCTECYETLLGLEEGSPDHRTLATRILRNRPQ